MQAAPVVHQRRECGRPEPPSVAASGWWHAELHEWSQARAAQEMFCWIQSRLQNPEQKEWSLFQATLFGVGYATRAVEYTSLFAAPPQQVSLVRGFAFCRFVYPQSVAIWKQVVLLRRMIRRSAVALLSVMTPKSLTSLHLVTWAFYHLTSSPEGWVQYNKVLWETEVTIT